jgi:hypothetical protein
MMMMMSNIAYYLAMQISVLYVTYATLLQLRISVRIFFFFIAIPAVVKALIYKTFITNCNCHKLNTKVDTSMYTVCNLPQYFLSFFIYLSS